VSAELSVLIPTTGRRPKLLAQVFEALHETVPDAQVLVLEGVTWGEGLNRLAERATGAYWSCCCDDTVPLPGWFEAGRTMLDEGYEPCSRYLNPDGSPLRPGTDDMAHGSPVAWARSFLLTPAIFAQVGPFLDATWYADIEYSERLHAAGWHILACDGFSFTHLDGERDWQTPEENAREQALYDASREARAVGW